MEYIGFKLAMIKMWTLCFIVVTLFTFIILIPTHGLKEDNKVNTTVTDIHDRVITDKGHTNSSIMNFDFIFDPQYYPYHYSPLCYIDSNIMVDDCYEGFEFGNSFLGPGSHKLVVVPYDSWHYRYNSNASSEFSWIYDDGRKDITSSK